MVEGGPSGVNMWKCTLRLWLDAFHSPLPLEIERAAVGIAWEREARDVDIP
jgi:hypothetical protein